MCSRSVVTALVCNLLTHSVCSCIVMYDIVFYVQELEVVNLEDDKRLSDEEIMDMAIIYRKETNRPLSKCERI